MTRDEVKALLQRRLEYTGDAFNASMIDAWYDELAHIDHGEGLVAMTRAARKGHVRLAQFHEELAAHRHNKTDRHEQVRPVGCVDCDGTGWRDAGNTCVERCDHSNPAPWPADNIPYDQGLAIISRIRAEMKRAREDVS